MPLNPFRWTGLHAFALAAAVVSCRPSTPPLATPAPAKEPAATSAGGGRAAGNFSSMPYDGPEVSIDVRPIDGDVQATVSVTFPTGGWELRSDDTKVMGGAGVAYLTFVGPGPDELVTQALEQKEWRWRSKEPFARAEVWVNIVRRGESPREPDYRLAARFPRSAR